MKFLRYLPILSFFIVFTYCEAIVELSLGMDDLFDSRNEQVEGTVKVAVSECKDSTDESKDSQSLAEAKKNIPGIFSKATFKDCYEESFNHYARFNLPFVVNPSNPDDTKDERIKLISSEEKPLSIIIPASVNQNLENLKKQSFGLDSLELKVNLNLKNDTGKKQIVHVLSAYVNKEPVVDSEIEVPAGKSVNINLANVAVDHALQKGKTGIFLKRKVTEPVEKKSCLGLF